MKRSISRQAVVAGIAFAFAALCAGFSIPRRAGDNVGTVAVRIFATIEEKCFLLDIVRYEATCEQQMAIYRASDRAAANNALRKIVELSRAGREKATRYWRFNHVIALTQARLAVIADTEGRREDAERLFASASVYGVLQARAWNQERGYKEESEVRRTAEQYRYIVAALDKNSKVKWKEAPTSR